MQVKQEQSCANTDSQVIWLVQGWKLTCLSTSPIRLVSFKIYQPDRYSTSPALEKNKMKNYMGQQRYTLWLQLSTIHLFSIVCTGCLFIIVCCFAVISGAKVPASGLVQWMLHKSYNILLGQLVTSYFWKDLQKIENRLKWRSNTPVLYSQLNNPKQLGKTYWYMWQTKRGNID